jgi:hypothetical protein
MKIKVISILFQQFMIVPETEPEKG